MEKDCNEIRYVIYGASSGGKKVFDTFKSFGIEVAFFVDGNEKLWGKEVYGKKVCCPDILMDEECRVVIASDFGYTAIKNKLIGMGIESKCILKEEVIKHEVNSLFNNRFADSIKRAFENSDKTQNVNKHSKKNIFIELIEGAQLGGVENWTYMLADGLYKNKDAVEVLAGYSEEHSGKWGEYYRDIFSGEYINYKKCIIELFDYMESRLPCVVILNKQQQLYYAAYMLKKIYPNDVVICSITHSDIEAYYVRQSYIKDDVDYTFGVSRNIAENLEMYGIEKNKIIFKETPVLFDERNKKNGYTKDNECIKIGFGGRLEAVAKRADLLIPFIERLEKLKLNYQLTIAGSGKLENEIKNYIKKQLPEKKVVFLGELPHSKMQEFWMGADIFISLSEFEGMPVSMLEAMKCGAVPVVTDVSGNREFVEDGVNGYILPVGDYIGIADKIAYLDKNRGRIAEMGYKASKTVSDRCNIDDYIKFFERKLNIRNDDEKSNSIYAGI